MKSVATCIPREKLSGSFSRVYAITLTTPF